MLGWLHNTFSCQFRGHLCWSTQSLHTRRLQQPICQDCFVIPSSLLIFRQHKPMKGKTFRARDYGCWKEFLEISFLESSNKMRPSWLSRLCSDLVVGSVKGGGANWFGSFDLQMNTVIRFNHINITPSRQDGAVYPHPTYTQCKSLKSRMRLKHTARFSPPHTFPKVSFSPFMPESKRNWIKIWVCNSKIQMSKAHGIKTADNNVKSGWGRASFSWKSQENGWKYESKQVSAHQGASQQQHVTGGPTCHFLNIPCKCSITAPREHMVSLQRCGPVGAI